MFLEEGFVAKISKFEHNDPGGLELSGKKSVLIVYFLITLFVN